MISANMLAVLSTLLALGSVAPPAASPLAGNGFRTDAAPRIDPVFDDVVSLRRSIDQFFALQRDMERVRDRFSEAVHDTLASLGPIGARPPESCPAELAPRYVRASEEGQRFLALGRRLAARAREIRRADELGDAVGLTPDYRIKAKKVRELHLALVRDYREMRAAFYDQLGAEMRHAGCKPAAAPSPSAQRSAGGSGEHAAPDPANANDWVLDAPDEDDRGARSPTAARPEEAIDTNAVGPAGGGGPAIWIQIDNTSCPEPSNLIIDGKTVGEIAGQKRIPVRTRSGPHELCVLPVREGGTCGAPGTVRRAYLYDGWTLAVRCER
jgi:hypothetical protein